MVVLMVPLVTTAGTSLGSCSLKHLRWRVPRCAGGSDSPPLALPWEAAGLPTPEDPFQHDGQRGQPPQPLDVLPADGGIDGLGDVHSQPTVLSKVLP